MLANRSAHLEALGFRDPGASPFLCLGPICFSANRKPDKAAQRTHAQNARGSREQAPQGKTKRRSERAEGAFVSTFVHLAITEGRDSTR